MSDFVRIRTENGREVSVGRAYAESLGEAVEILDAPATNGRGLPLGESRRDGRRAKPKTTVKKAASKRAATRKAASKKAATSTTPSEPGATTNTADGAAVDPPQEA